MYRYSVDNAVTYTQDDLVLFRDSPFAVWMERLTLENPDHGILPDISSAVPAHQGERRDNLAATLRAEGRQVFAIETELDETERRALTLAAMRDGADFIVSGQLAVATLSGRINLLMRTSGYSDLGDYLYIPCETQSGNDFHTAFRLAFSADLLHSLQGQLPPQMLIIREDADVVPLQTEDHIYYYRAVLKRFQRAMGTFRKHRMPDPAESSHFGRWSECASEVLKQRAQREQYQAEEQSQQAPAEERVEMPQLRVATGAASPQESYDTTSGVSTDVHARLGGTGAQEATTAGNRESGYTLVEQALQLATMRPRAGAAPGRTPNLARFPVPESATPETEVPETDEPQTGSDGPGFDASLENLEFIGSNGVQTIPLDGHGVFAPEKSDVSPAPNLSGPADGEEESGLPGAEALVSGPAEHEPAPPLFLPPHPAPLDESSSLQQPPESHFDRRPLFDMQSLVDPDNAPSPALGVPRQDKKRASEDGEVVRRDFRTPSPGAARDGASSGEARPSPPPFGDRLNTSDTFDEE